MKDPCDRIDTPTSPTGETYTVVLSDILGDEYTTAIAAEHLADARRQARDLLDDWIREGDWGIEGASISGHWALIDTDGAEVDDGGLVVEIDPDEDALIRQAGGDPYCDHDWVADGGDDENPGVWAVGRTAHVYASRCAVCSIRRIVRDPGEQRDPGECRTMRFEW